MAENRSGEDYAIAEGEREKSFKFQTPSSEEQHRWRTDLRPLVSGPKTNGIPREQDAVVFQSLIQLFSASLRDSP